MSDLARTMLANASPEEKARLLSMLQEDVKPADVKPAVKPAKWTSLADAVADETKTAGGEQYTKNTGKGAYGGDGWDDKDKAFNENHVRPFRDAVARRVYDHFRDITTELSDDNAIALETLIIEIADSKNAKHVRFDTIFKRAIKAKTEKKTSIRPQDITDIESFSVFAGLNPSAKETKKAYEAFISARKQG